MLPTTPGPIRSLRRVTSSAAFVVAATSLLVACGGDDPAASSATSAPATIADATADATEDATATAGATQDLPPEGRGLVTENADGSRTVVSTWGETVVPAEPQRIVSVIGDIDFEAMLALGVTPVGAGTQGGSVASGFSPHIDPAAIRDVEPLPWADGTPFEQIAALEPDLIFAPDQESYDLLAEIAPTVPRGTWNGAEWKQDFVYVGEVLGLGDEAQAMIAEHDARVADLSARLAEAVPGLTVASPQVSFDQSGVSVDGPDQFSSAVLTELGFSLAPVVSAGDGWSTEVSFERLTEIDADVLFWQVRQDDDGQPNTAALAKVEDNPLWPSLPAVAADQVHFVDNRPWYFPTILGADRILDDVEAALLPG